jgi:hypothetical protein
MGDPVPLEVAIDALILPERNDGGLALALLALVRARGPLSDGDEAQVLVVDTAEQAAFW